MYRIHDQSALDAGEAPEGRVCALQFVHDQPIGHVAYACGTVSLGQVGAQQPELTQFEGEMLWEPALLPPIGYVRLYLVIHKLADRRLNLNLLRFEEIGNPVVVKHL